MLLDRYLRESDEATLDDIDMIAGGDDPDSAAGIANAAMEVEMHMTTNALESMTYFEGGDQVVRNFTESAEVRALVEARKMSKRTFVRLGKNDDLQRRTNLACLVLAKNHNDPLWTKLARNRVMERKLRNAIYAKYGQKANRVAKKSQLVHIQQMKKMKPLLPIKFN